MKTFRLGRSDFQVTEVGFGALPLQRLHAAEAERVVRRALERGINFIDTARAYTVSEGYLAAALAGCRDQVVLATKTQKTDAAGAREHLETSLRTLQVETIDLYQLHGVNNRAAWDQATGPGGALEALAAAKQAGLIREIGLTSHSLEMALLAAESGLFCTIMYPFNFIMTDAAQRVIPACREKGATFIAMKPMGGGMFPRADVALSYFARFPDVLKLVGMEKVEEVDEVVELAEAGFPASADAQAEMVRQREALGTRFCRRCGYCLPCPQGIPIPLVMVFEAVWARLSPEQALASS
ncbi:MAG: aldo/keto reductase, partial [Chloroflexi bacterium]|nr:aldo/keto reductase [Chloroflexota bacterium]